MPPAAKPLPPPEAPKPTPAESAPAEQSAPPQNGPQPASQTASKTVNEGVVEHPFVGPTLQEVEASQRGMSLITPQPGERYIQVGAFNEEATRRFVERLRNTSRQPHVAAGPTPQILRVLIGPFDDPGKLAEEKKRLESEGVDTFVRRY
jgi:cell division septation protein DedD